MITRVLNTSVAAMFLFDSQRDPRARELLEDDAVEFAAPHLLTYEIANTAHQLIRRGSITASEAVEALDIFRRIPIHFVDAPGWSSRAFSIAQQFRQRAIYDAIYLACAEDLDAELWTRDRRFVASFGGTRPALLRLYPDDLPV